MVLYYLSPFHLQAYLHTRYPSRRLTTKAGQQPRRTAAGQVIFSGIQPTGVPHIGNYLGALQQWVHLQNNAAPSTQLLFSIVDLHAITLPQDRNMLQRWRKETLATLLAVGLDPKRCTIFFQSDVCLSYIPLTCGKFDESTSLMGE